jgi:hypothetical protein
MDSELRPQNLSELKTGKVIGNYERQRLLGVAELNVHEIVHMIEENEADTNILAAITSLDSILHRLEVNLAEILVSRRKRIGRSAGRTGKNVGRPKDPT